VHWYTEVEQRREGVGRSLRPHLGVLVGEAGAQGLHHGGAGEVLRRDQLDAAAVEVAEGRQTCESVRARQRTTEGRVVRGAPGTREKEPGKRDVRER